MATYFKLGHIPIKCLDRIEGVDDIPGCVLVSWSLNMTKLCLVCCIVAMNIERKLD